MESISENREIVVQDVSEFINSNKTRNVLKIINDL